MSRSVSLAIAVLLTLSASNRCGAQIKPDAIDGGKRATVLVRISHEGGFTFGSAFCVDKSGLFLTTAGVVEKAAAKGSALGLIIDGGLKTQRVRRAKVLRQDEEANLALLQIAREPGLVPLELAQDAGLKELEEVYALGYPLGNALGRMVASGPRASPDVTIMPSRIATLHREGGRLAGFDLDTPITPGHSGGPVIDGAGKVVGVVVASALVGVSKPVIPVGRVAEFLAAPGLAFDPPPLTYKDRAQPATWPIQVVPPTPGATLPEGVSVAVTVSYPFGDPRTFPAQPKGSAGAFEAKVIPVPQVLPRKVALGVWDGPRFRYQAIVNDDEVSVGNQKFRLSELRSLIPGASPSVQTAKGQTVNGPISGLGKVTVKVGAKSRTVDLNEAPRIGVTYLQPPPAVSKIDILVEARQGSKLLARLRREIRLDLASPNNVAATPGTVGNRPVTASGRPLSRGDGRLRLGGELNVDGMPLGAGKSIQPTRIKPGAARLEKGAGAPDDAPYVFRLVDTISDVVVGGGGRYLLLTLKQGETGALAIFDVNLATLLKRIPLSSPNALVAAGAKKFLIALPDENRLQCWDLDTLQPLGEARASPIEGRLKSLAIGSDSDGPALAFRGVGPKPYGLRPTWLSLIDLDSLDVLRVGSIVLGGSGHQKGIESLSPSGGAFTALTYVGERSFLHIRASAGGGLFGMWDSSPGGFHTLSIYGNSLIGTNVDGPFAHVVPGPDGRTVYTGLASRLDPSGTQIGGSQGSPNEPPEVMIPTSDPLYYLAIAGLTGSLPSLPRTVVKPGSVTASIHATGDGSRLLTIHGLDEMADLDRNDLFITNDLTIDKRFHLVPAANLLITIPPENDRLVLRRLDLREALDRVGGDYMAVAALPTLIVTPGQKIEQTIVARSKAGGLTYTLANGPKGLSVTPEGKIVWEAPKDLEHKDGELRAIVSVGDRSGKEVFLTLKIRVK
jgi:S1-C subfamily serine protease